MKNTDNNHTILVVDDQMGVRRLLFEAFQEEGYKVDMAANGPDALEKLTRCVLTLCSWI